MRVSEMAVFMSRQRYSTAIQQINYPMHQGRQNPAHGKFFFVGSIPARCYDETTQQSLRYDTEEDAILAAIEAGAEVIQGADCRIIDPNDYIDVNREAETNYLRSLGV
jgi:hypothetical protein